MAFLPPSPLTLSGGCYCRAVRYEISVPALEDRPLVPGAVETFISPFEKVPTRVPVVDLDHCGTCRSTSGAIIQCWFICPIGWVEWSLLLKPPPGWPKDDSLEGLDAQRMKLPTRLAVGSQTIPAIEDTYLTHFQATDRAIRTFCARCGTHLSYANIQRTDPTQAVVDVTVGSLDPESLKLVRPDRHGWWDSGTEWIKDLMRAGTGNWLMRHQTGDVSRVIEDDDIDIDIASLDYWPGS